MHTVEFHSQAFAELQSSALWYDLRSPGLGEEFLAEVERTIEAIRANPKTWPIYSRGTRRCLIHRFPFAVIYRLRGDVVQIPAIMHLRRRPGYWTRRLKDM